MGTGSVKMGGATDEAGRSERGVALSSLSLMAAAVEGKY